MIKWVRLLILGAGILMASTALAIDSLLTSM